jgi:choline dehydrogenase-like flavoprotein
MSNANKSYDYIIVGGGLAGSVLTRRLSDKYPNSSILVIEAGQRPEGHPLIGPPMACFGAHGSDIDWAYLSVPQKHWGNKPAYQAGGELSRSHFRLSETNRRLTILPSLRESS